jgi:endonuclease/exonuclease/phosphatase family metal-dependent hydrolase
MKSISIILKENVERPNRPAPTYYIKTLLALTVILLGGMAYADKSPTPLTVTTWNMEHLGTIGRGFGGGYGGSGRGSIPECSKTLPLRTDADLERIADFIANDLKSDLFALQEVGVTGLRSGRSLSKPLDKIIKHLNSNGAKWVYFIPQVHETPPPDSEDNIYLGFLWNQNRVHLITIFEMSVPNLYMGGPELFKRTPLVGYFEALGKDGLPKNDFALANVHFASGQGFDENHLIAMTLIETMLSKNLAKYAVAESDIIIMGDLNDNPTQVKADGSPKYSPAMHQHMRFKGYIDLVTSDMKTTRMNSGLDSLIDHILVNKSAQVCLVSTNATIYKPGGKKGSPALYGEWRRSFSDHFPISFQLQIEPDDDVDFF